MYETIKIVVFKVSTLVALRRPDRIHGIIFLGPGFNALRPGYWHHYNLLSAEDREKVDLGLQHVKINMRSVNLSDNTKV